MKLEDLKEVVSELLNEYVGDDITGAALEMDAEDKRYAEEHFRSISSKASAKERKILKRLAVLTYNGKVGTNSFEDMLQMAASNIGLTADDFTLDHKATAEYICSVVVNGKDGFWLKLGPGKPDACPAHWGVSPSMRPKPTSSSAGGSGDTPIDPAKLRKWFIDMPAQDGETWKALRDVYIRASRTHTSIDFDTALNKAERASGGSSRYIRMDMSFAERVARQEFGALMENKKKKKRGFGEGDPPDEEIYKKREVVQEIDAEAPEAAKALGDASKEQGEATQGVADAHTRGAEAAKQRQDASKVWKDSKIAQVQAVEAAEALAKKEADQQKAQEDALAAAQKAAAAGEALGNEKDKYLKIAQKAAEQEQEAAQAAQDAAKAEEEAAAELADTNTDAAKAGEERSELESEFGDAITSDDEARAEEEEEKTAEEEEAAAEEEEAKKAEQEADKKQKEDEMKAADEKAAQEAEEDAAKEKSEQDSEEKAEEAEQETVTEVLKAMVREVMMERKWGDEKAAAPTPQQKLKAAGITADELRGMVLTTVMKGEEDRDMQMIKLLQSMLDSLQSIEYHATPEKGAFSKSAQAAAKGWLTEGDNQNAFASVFSVISEMRKVGLHAEADDHESFIKWALTGEALTLQEIKNEADAQIADLKKMLRKMSDHVTGKEDSLEKQKLRGEVPGHH